MTIDVIERAIESAKCRIYRVRANVGQSLEHQVKADNQTEIQQVTIEALEKQSFFNPKIETAVESRNVYEHGYMRGKQDGLDKADEWLREKLKRIVERLEELEEEYAYPDDDEYTAGHYSAFKNALKIVKEEGGFDV